MKLYILEKDEDTKKLLIDTIEARDIGKYSIGQETVEEALEEIEIIEPDILIAGLIFENKNGLSLIREIKAKHPQTHVVVVSQILSKEVIGMAYKSGAEYYLTKPLDILEIESVLERVKEKIEIKKKLEQIKDLLLIKDLVLPKQKPEEDQKKINKTMQKLGILGETGCRDIVDIVSYLAEEGSSMADYSLKEICQLFSDNPKSMEQRIRRAALTGMVNIANLGIEDYMNETFMEYSNGLYSFEQIKCEMDYIRKKGSKRGAVNIKKFIDNMLYYAKE